MELNKKQIFIIGAQRSGTTLLRLILNAHSQIAVTREAEFLVPFLKRKYLHRLISSSFLKAYYSDYLLSVKDDIKFYYTCYTEFFSQLSQKEKLSLKDLIDDMFSSYCHIEGKSIWGNKTPTFYSKIDILFTLFPNARFIHIIRDGRDVFDSRRKLRPFKSNEVAVTALDWSYKLFRIEKSFKKIPTNNRITIRYEDLLENPEATIKSICSLIGVEYQASIFDFHQTSGNYLSPRHSKLIFNPINKNNKFKWKNNLTSREVKIFNLLARHYLKKYNYEIKNDMLNFSGILFMFKSLFIGISHKLIEQIGVKRVFKKAIRKGQFMKGVKK